MLTFFAIIAPLIAVGLAIYLSLKITHAKARTPKQTQTGAEDQHLFLTRSVEDAVKASKQARAPKDLEQQLLSAYEEAKTFEDPTLAQMIYAELQEIRSAKRPHKTTPPKN